MPLGKLDEAEKALLSAAVKELGPSIDKVCHSLQVEVLQISSSSTTGRELRASRSPQALDGVPTSGIRILNGQVISIENLKKERVQRENSIRIDRTDMYMNLGNIP